MSTHNLDKIVGRLNTIQSTEEAREYLNELKLTKPALAEIAQHYDIPVITRDNKPYSVEKIVLYVVDAKI